MDSQGRAPRNSSFAETVEPCGYALENYGKIALLLYNKRTEIRYYIVSGQWYFKTYPQLTIYKQEQKQGLLQNSPYLLREQLLTDC